MLKKFSFNLLSIIILCLVFLFSFSPICFGAYPKLVSTIITAFETVETWILRIATPAAAVAVRNWCIHEKIQFW